MPARKKATRKGAPRKKAARKKKAPRKKAARRDQSARPARKGSPRAARIPTGGPGKPRVFFNLKKLEAMARDGNSHDTMATLCDCSRSTLDERIGDTPEVAAAIERGRAKGHVNLRSWQWRAARRGNITMMIWLGKNHLGQSDKMIHAGDPDAPVMGDLGDALTAKLQEYITHRRRSEESPAE